MFKSKVSWILLTLLLALSLLMFTFNIEPVKSETNTIIVPDDYPTIQEAINNANDGDTIFVRNGTYYEHVFVNKAVSLVGENRSTTIIDGDGVGTIIHVGGVDSFNISDFTLRNGYQGVVAWGNCNISNNRILSNGLEGLLLGGENNIITHNKISNMHDGIYIRSSRHSKIVCNDIISNGRCGIWSGDSVDLLIANNTFSKNSKGIWASTRTDATIVNNTISHNGIGLILYCAGGSFLANNNITQNDYNLRVEGKSLSDFELDMDTSNTVNGRSVYYLVRKKDVLIDSSTYPNVGYLGVVDSKNVTVQDLSFTGNYEGVLCAYTTDSMIRNVTATNHWSGIYLRSSHRNKIVGNEISSAIWGIYIVRCQNNSIEDNTISGNVRGLYYAYCDHNVVSHNIVRNNFLGIFLDSTINNTLFGNVIDYNKYSFGVVGQQLKHFFHRIDTSNLVEGKPIYYFINRKNLTVNSLTYPEIGYLALINSTCTIIENVTMTNSYNGVLLAYTNDSRLTGNTITNSMFSVYLCYSHNNTIYHNNFIDNRYSSQCFQCLNAWDDGFPSGGNYRSVYSSTDGNHDGIGDAPYVIDENNTDRYPLMGMFSSFHTSLGYSVNVISNSTIDDFKYHESNNTIEMHVSNSSSTQQFGFCRVCIPKGLMAPPYTVIIDNRSAEVLYFNDTIYDNGTHRWIYFAYQHSVHEVVILGFPPDTTSPTVSILSPQNTTYASTLVPLNFTVDETTSWIGYSLDAQANATITGNTTLTSLFEGAHSITVYANDTAGNMGASETVYFTISLPYSPDAAFTAIPDTASTGESIKFDASASLSGWNGTHEMPIIEYRWDFGDGNETITSTPIVYHSFSSSANYYVTLTVYAPGATPETDSVTHKVTITAIPVGGYSFPIKGYAAEKPLTLYLALVAILTASFTIAKRRKKQQS